MKKLLPILFCALFVSCSSHLYDGAIKYDDYAYISCDRNYVTEESLTDTYFNYFADSDLDYMIIQYNDDPDHGVYMNKSTIYENAKLSLSDNGYMLADDSEAILYIPQDNELKKQ